MKNIAYFFILLLLGCDHNIGNKPEVVTCIENFPLVMTLTVDYTTNRFLGGYMVPLPVSSRPFRMVCRYEAPGDFGSVTWYDRSGGTELFSGTIVWAGKGKRTFPETIIPPTDFTRLATAAEMPDIIPLFHDANNRDEDVDYAPVWQAVADLQWVSWVQASTPVYLYLYCPSVGVGNPPDWYWVAFLMY